MNIMKELFDEVASQSPVDDSSEALAKVNKRRQNMHEARFRDLFWSDLRTALEIVDYCYNYSTNDVDKVLGKGTASKLMSAIDNLGEIGQKMLVELSRKQVQSKDGKQLHGTLSRQP